MKTEHPIEAPGERELFDDRVAENLYGVTRSWFRKRRHLRLPPPYVQVGRMVRYRRCDLDAFFAAHIVEPDGEGRGGKRETTGEPQLLAVGPNGEPSPALRTRGRDQPGAARRGTARFLGPQQEGE
jgi:hypothetical protein